MQQCTMGTTMFSMLCSLPEVDELHLLTIHLGMTEAGNGHNLLVDIGETPTESGLDPSCVHDYFNVCVL